jgi:hypothetical protein
MSLLKQRKSLRIMRRLFRPGETIRLAFSSVERMPHVPIAR